MEEDEFPPFIVFIFYLERADNQKQKQQQKSTKKYNSHIKKGKIIVHW